MQKIIILHTNDIHGRAEGVARIITKIEQIRVEHPDDIVLYFDCGDVEDTTNFLSNVTKGHSMHRLLALAKPDAMTVGNGSILRYGAEILANYQADYPLLLANLHNADGSQIKGTQPTTILELGDFRLGVIGVTAPIEWYASTFGLTIRDTGEVVKNLAQELKANGADAVIVLSHLGYKQGNPNFPLEYPDPQLAEVVQGQVALILGAHSHDLLEHGNKVGDVWIAQAGCYAEYLGCVTATWDGENFCIEAVEVLPITEAIPPSPKVQALEAEIAAEADEFLDQPIGEITHELDWAYNRECGIGNLGADAFRERFNADIGIAVTGATAEAGLLHEIITRRQLWQVSTLSANPTLAKMKGEHLAAMLERGWDLDFAKEEMRVLRGLQRGLMHVSGVERNNGTITINGDALDPDKIYRVAGTDFELQPNFGHVEKAWELELEFEVPTITRDVLEDYLTTHQPVTVKMGRLG